MVPGVRRCIALPAGAKPFKYGVAAGDVTLRDEDGKPCGPFVLNHRR